MDTKRRSIDVHLQDRPDYLNQDQTGRLQLVTCYLKCDNVGVYKHSKLAAFLCGGEVNLKEFVDIVNSDEKRFELLSDDKIWIRDFIRDTWGTISAKNNLGKSCYKLLVKHGLLDRFVRDYPNCINLVSFREAITENQKGYGDLPLPQPSPSPAPENSNSKEYEGQTSPKAGTINNNIPINSSKDISITTPENAEEKDTNEIEDEELFGRPALKKTETKKEETSIEFEMRQKGILKDSPFK